MQSNARELWAAFLAALAITGLYLLFVLRAGAVPAAGELVGHGIGLLGFVLMLMTETLYSLRKRTRRAHWGRMSTWLRFHIFTGLVGPYMVFLHTAFRFNGLAGIAMLMTAVVVASGVVGRYIYTAIPRTSDGIEMQAEEVERAIRETEQELQALAQTRPQAAAFVGRRTLLAQGGSGAVALQAQAGARANSWLRRWRDERGLDPQARAQVRQLETMLGRRKTLQGQIATLARARRAMSIWHAVHIPLGLALFTAAFVHAAAGLYYVTFMR
jgi:hypothetical protein